MTGPLLDVQHLSVHFHSGGVFARGRPLRAVDDVSFSIGPHEVVGLVGESGSGRRRSATRCCAWSSPLPVGYCLWVRT